MQLIHGCDKLLVLPAEVVPEQLRELHATLGASLWFNRVTVALSDLDAERMGQLMLWANRLKGG